MKLHPDVFLLPVIILSIFIYLSNATLSKNDPKKPKTKSDSAIKIKVSDYQKIVI